MWPNELEIQCCRDRHRMDHHSLQRVHSIKTELDINHIILSYYVSFTKSLTILQCEVHHSVVSFCLTMIATVWSTTSFLSASSSYFNYILDCSFCWCKVIIGINGGDIIHIDPAENAAASARVPVFVWTSCFETFAFPWLLGTSAIVAMGLASNDNVSIFVNVIGWLLFLEGVFIFGSIVVH